MKQSNLTQLISNIGNMDIYLIDQLLKGRLVHCQNILDAGCGTGRNLSWFLQNDLEITALDPDSGNLDFIKEKVWHAGFPARLNLVCDTIESMQFEAETFDLIICNAVLHFAKNISHFDQMLQSMWKVLKSNGILFIRTASDIGIESLVKQDTKAPEEGWCLLPDGSSRFLINQKVMMDYTKEWNANLLEPIKTTNVQNLRSMSTWIVSKR